eukprot:CAMPEP_0182542180 /NCGR_PEP_ID=MMETSP1323-20130603/29763_1 /TAXON_ID=236787 /ORGANISM="Florenciella parvula, Strain RCC1693" /LENGTH=364 /DNA_ID=CAMNT_0024753007 /DNA_START=27 /DNA_END=1121 /DNA_ORIENTATION=+
MKLKTAIVGLPNVGKSTLFNALTGGESAQAANFPFCTIEPNTGIVEVPDQRLVDLSAIHDSAKVVKATMEFVDVAGLVKGASGGEGLGNKFLANIRECDAIVHVVRCFDDENVIHVDGTVDPLRDIEVISLELALSDLEQVEKRIGRVRKDKSADKNELSGLEKVLPFLEDGRAARLADLTEEESKGVRGLGLLTAKPIIYAANVEDTELSTGNPMVEKVREFAKTEGSNVVIVSAQVEAELAGLELDEKNEFLEELGVPAGTPTGLEQMVQSTYGLLGLQTYFTVGPQETRAWTIKKGFKAPQAAGVIHDDFERGFIKAETIGYKDLLESGDEKIAKEKGLLRMEGKDYEVQDGDCILFRFNV